MYRLVFKEPGDLGWRYEEWVEDYHQLLKNYRLKTFFVQNEEHMIVYSS